MNLHDIKKDYDFDYLEKHSIKKVSIDVEKVKWLIQQVESMEEMNIVTDDEIAKEIRNEALTKPSKLAMKRNEEAAKMVKKLRGEF